MFSTPSMPLRDDDAKLIGGPSAGAGSRHPYYSAGHTSLLDPVFVFRTIWAWRWLIIATTILGLVLASFVALAIPKKYTATSQVLVDPRDIKVVQNEVTPNGLPSEATLALIESQISVIYSNSLLTNVIDKADLTADPEFNGNAPSPFAFVTDLLPSFGGDDGEAAGETELRTLDNFREELGVARDPKSFVINISVTTKDPEKSARLSRLVASTFIAQMGEVQAETARKASDALSGRLSELRQTVASAERAVEDYKAKNQLVGVGGQLVDDNYINRINDQLSRGRADIASLRVKADQMRSANVDDVVKGTLPEELTSEALTRLRQSYSDLLQQKAVLSSTLGPRHPQRISNEQALSSARNAIRAELSRIVAAAQTELSRAEQTNADLTKQLSDLKTKQLDTSSAFVKLRELEREVDASRAVYEAFLLRARETGEQESLNTNNVRVISEATPPLKPSGVSRRVIVAGGGILGLLLGLAIATLIAVVRLFREISKGQATVDARPMSQRGLGQGGALVAFAGAGGSGRYAPSPQDARSSYGPMTTTGHLSFGPGLSAAERGSRFDDRSGQGDGIEGLRPALGAGASDLRRPADEPARAAGDRPASEASLDEEAHADETPNASSADGRDQGADGRSPQPLAPARSAPMTRRSLRDRVRAIAAERSGDAPIAMSNDPEIARLQRDIAEAKQHIASIRQRRSGTRRSD